MLLGITVVVGASGRLAEDAVEPGGALLRLRQHPQTVQPFAQTAWQRGRRCHLNRLVREHGAHVVALGIVVNGVEVRPEYHDVVAIAEEDLAALEPLPTPDRHAVVLIVHLPNTSDRKSGIGSGSGKSSAHPIELSYPCGNIAECRAKAEYITSRYSYWENVVMNEELAECFIRSFLPQEA